MTLQLEGRMDTSQQDIAALRKELADTKLRLAHAELEATHAKQEAGNSVGALRRILEPLYRALQAVFGEMEAIPIQDAPMGQSSQANAKWELWKKRFPNRGAALIDVLLIHEQMNTKQLSTALKCDPRTLAQLIFKLNQAGLIQKNGNMFALKEI